MQFGWPSQGNRRHKLCSISATSTGWLIRSIALVLISTLQWNEWYDQSEASSRTNFCPKQARSKFQPGRILCNAVPFWCCVRHLWGELILCSSFEKHFNTNRWATTMRRRINSAQIWTFYARRTTTLSSQDVWKPSIARFSSLWKHFYTRWTTKRMVFLPII